MEPTSLTTNVGFDRLQDMLLAMHAGDEVTPAGAAQTTGLKEHVCLAVFQGLERVGLMTRAEDGRFVRKTLDVTAA